MQCGTDMCITMPKPDAGQDMLSRCMLARVPGLQVLEGWNRQHCRKGSSSSRLQCMDTRQPECQHCTPKRAPCTLACLDMPMPQHWPCVFAPCVRLAHPGVASHAVLVDSISSCDDCYIIAVTMLLVLPQPTFHSVRHEHHRRPAARCAASPPMLSVPFKPPTSMDSAYICHPLCIRVCVHYQYCFCVGECWHWHSRACIVWSPWMRTSCQSSHATAAAVGNQHRRCHCDTCTCTSCTAGMRAGADYTNGCLRPDVRVDMDQVTVGYWQTDNGGQGCYANQWCVQAPS